ncbi:MAG: YkgJ family cysteine cluster protein [Myxococcota bacterium]
MDVYLLAAFGVMALGFFEIFNRFRVIRTLGSVFTVSLIHMELAAVGLVRKLHPPKHAVVGSCVKCGDCCKSIVANPPRFLKRDPWVRWFAAYHRFVHNFRPVARGEDGEIIFSCGHLRPDNRCGIYWRRPMLCRTYPVLPYYDAPQLMPQCSYQVTARVVTEMKPRASLPIVNPQVAVYHPTPESNEPRYEDFELVEMNPELPAFPARAKNLAEREESAG